ncbi:hypothetical protein [Streptomyces sp. NPDC051561]|uniref:hypothetical protein n=1 Tax=Streptomyces sp. NPDC051561 TaxID=3365658 RepID=UPI0037B56191
MTRLDGTLPGPGPAPGPNPGHGVPTWGPDSPLGRLRDSPEYDPSAKWVRLGAALLLVPLMLADLMFLGLSPMALDKCDPEACAQIRGAISTSGAALSAAAALLVASLCLTSRRKRRAARWWLVVGAATAAVASLGALFTL